MRLLIILLLTIASIETTWSCDACDMFNYTSLKNKSYLALNYRYRVFNGFNTLSHSNYFNSPSYSNAKTAHIPGDDGNLYLESQQDYELFQTLDLTFNYALRHKFNLIARLPYRYNEDYFAEVVPAVGPIKDSLTTVNGFGDFKIMIERFENINSENWRQVIKGGIGLTLPTGAFQLKDADGRQHNPQHQPGKGTYDIMISGAYMAMHKSWFGTSFDIAYRQSSKQQNKNLFSSGGNVINKNTVDYQFGSSINAQLSAFYVWSKNDWRIVPKFGLYHERIHKDKLNQNEIESTGGLSVFLNPGLDLSYQEITLQLLFQEPIWQKLNGTQLENAGRFQIGLLYNFVKKPPVQD